MSIFQTGQAVRPSVSSMVEADHLHGGTPVSQDRYTDAVRKAMDRLPVSRRELARRAELSHTTLNDIARGKQPASAAVVEAVADAVADLSSDMAVARDALKGAVQAARRELKRERRKEADDG